MRMTERLDLWALIHISIMIVIGFTQVYKYQIYFKLIYFFNTVSLDLYAATTFRGEKFLVQISE